MISFVLFPQVSQPSMNFNISELVNTLTLERLDMIAIDKLSCKIATQRVIAEKFQPWTRERRMREVDLDDNTIKKI